MYSCLTSFRCSILALFCRVISIAPFLACIPCFLIILSCVSLCMCRAYPGKGWSSRLLNTDRPAWSDESGKTATPRDSFTLPSDDWMWDGDWEIDYKLRRTGRFRVWLWLGLGLKICALSYIQRLGVCVCSATLFRAGQCYVVSAVEYAYGSKLMSFRKQCQVMIILPHCIDCSLRIRISSLFAYPAASTCVCVLGKACFSPLSVCCYVTRRG